MNETSKFALTYRISNTAGWRVWAIYDTIEEARAGRKAVPSIIPTNDPTVRGRVLGTDIRPAYEWEVEGRA